MKKSFAKLMALLLVFSMLLPMASYAASTYDVYVSISDADSPDGPRTNTTIKDKRRYVSGSSRMAEVLAEVVLRNYKDMYKFDSPEMKRRMDEGLEIAAGNGPHPKEDWTQYANYLFTCSSEELHAKLAKYDTTVAEVGAGTHIVQHSNNEENDDKYGVTYTVTIIITERSSGGGSTKPQEPQPEEPTVVVDTGKTEGGEVVISNPDAKPGDTVEITAKPETEKYVHHIDVRDENGDKVPMTYVGKGEYSFVMPEGEVTITPSFQTQATDPAVSGVSRLLNADDHVAFMQGFGTGDFRPTASITRAQVATIFYRLLLDQNVEITKSFDDVSEDYWAHNAIATLASLGILNGMTEDHYDPNRQITRAQFAAICARFAYTLTGLGGQTSFTDVPASHWAHDEIETAVSYGWINGYDDGSFNPGAPITRAQAAAIVNRMFARIADQIAVDDGERRDYTDVNDAYWAWYDIQEASTGHDFEDETGFRHEYWDDSEVAALKS